MVKAAESELLADLYPAFNEYASKQVKQIMESTDGRSYENGTYQGTFVGLPNVSVETDGIYIYFIRQDWLDECGLEVPKTIADLENAARTFMEKGLSPNYAIAGVGQGVRAYANFLESGNKSYGFDAVFQAMDSYPGFFLEDGEGKIYYGTNTEETKKTLELLAKWYADGLINPELGVSTNGDEAAGVKGGTCGIFMGPWWSLGYGNGDSYKNDPEANWQAYDFVMGDDAFWKAFLVSVQRVVYGTVFTMVVIIMMAYPLSKNKREYKPRNAFMWLLIFCMLFNGGTIPWFITVKNYGMLDTMAALVLAGSVPVFNVILLMNFFRNLPSDLEEAAAIDGAGPWRILWQIVVPCSVPVIATVVLFTSVGYWNEFFQGLILMQKAENYPLQTYIKQIVVQIPVGVTLTAEQYQQLNQNSNKALEAAKVFIAMVPMLVIYPFLQKYFVNGITLGAVKE